MKILATAVLLILVFTLSAFAATPVCKDINTGVVIECPADSTVMPWDHRLDPPQDMTEKEFEYLVFFLGTISVAVLSAVAF